MLIFCRIYPNIWDRPEEEDDIRAELPKYANWPTFPQLWVDGELVGGCDIVIEMYQRGELQQLIKETAAKYKSEEPDAE